MCLANMYVWLVILYLSLWRVVCAQNRRLEALLSDLRAEVPRRSLVLPQLAAECVVAMLHAEQVSFTCASSTDFAISVLTKPSLMHCDCLLTERGGGSSASYSTRAGFDC